MDLEAMEISGYKQRFGAVALLDGLGTKSASVTSLK